MLIALMTAQVFFRYVINKPLGWTEELARFTFIWSIFLGAAIAARERQHVRVDIVRYYLPETGKLILNIFIDSCIVIFLAFIIPPAYRYAVYAIKIKAVASEISMFFVYVSLPLCGLLMAIHYVHNILGDFSKLLKRAKRKDTNLI